MGHISYDDNTWALTMPSLDWWCASTKLGVLGGCGPSLSSLLGQTGSMHTVMLISRIEEGWACIIVRLAPVVAKRSFSMIRCPMPKRVPPSDKGGAGRSSPGTPGSTRIERIVRRHDHAIYIQLIICVSFSPPIIKLRDPFHFQTG